MTEKILGADVLLESLVSEKDTEKYLAFDVVL
jgi:hypothetical protein